ncbi:Endonuclease V [Acropora cervicornis]|uniref:Endonuclease V n=1 Tax=Acropora cervicornis TaxID=6130 RepID=A0AAD9Q9C5_ACRCE|nr:Endonuclease V [Acropora cervicornis]
MCMLKCDYLSQKTTKIVYEDLRMVHLTLPYVPEYLAFREVKFLVELISTMKKQKPNIFPQAILVDGNGMLHPRDFGIACHLGVVTDIPTVGVAKKLFHVDGIEHNSQHADQIRNELKVSGDSFPLQGSSGKIWGKALRSTQESVNPIYVSIGHKIGLETAADIKSREYLRQHYAEQLKSCSCRIKTNVSSQNAE